MTLFRVQNHNFKLIMNVFNPRESGEFIVQNADHLIVHRDGIEKLSLRIFEAIKSGGLRSENFSQNNPGLHPSSNDPKAVEWIFLLDTLNFCFWTPGKSFIQAQAIPVNMI